MKKMYNFKNLDCAHCALIIQENIRKISCVKNCILNFLAQKMILEFDLIDKERVLKEVVNVARQTVPNFTLIM